MSSRHRAGFGAVVLLLGLGACGSGSEPSANDSAATPTPTVSDRAEYAAPVPEPVIEQPVLDKWGEQAAKEVAALATDYVGNHQFVDFLDISLAEANAKQFEPVTDLMTDEVSRLFRRNLRANDKTHTSSIALYDVYKSTKDADGNTVRLGPRNDVPTPVVQRQFDSLRLVLRNDGGISVKTDFRGVMRLTVNGTPQRLGFGFNQSIGYRKIGERWLITDWRTRALDDVDREPHPDV